MGKELNYPRYFEGSQDYKPYVVDLSTERTDVPLPQAIGEADEDLPFDVTYVCVIRNDADDWQVQLKFDDTSKDPIAIPKVIAPSVWTIKYATRRIYITNPSIPGAYLYLVVFA